MPVYPAFCSRHCIYDLCIAGGNADREFQEESPIYYRCNSGRFASCNSLLGNLYVMSTYNTLNKISGVNTQTSQIGVYVLKDDSAQSIEDAKSYTFGILSNLDTENTQAAVKQIEERTGQSVKTQEENGVTKLVDSLLDGSCDAVILNHAYLPVLEDMEGYADIEVRSENWIF